MVINLFNMPYRPDGGKYKGSWVDDRQHGVGTCITSNGKHRNGVWVKGKCVKWLDGNGRNRNYRK
jgi:hypothetical protein